MSSCGAERSPPGMNHGDLLRHSVRTSSRADRYPGRSPHAGPRRERTANRGRPWGSATFVSNGTRRPTVADEDVSPTVGVAEGAGAELQPAPPCGRRRPRRSSTSCSTVTAAELLAGGCRRSTSPAVPVFLKRFRERSEGRVVPLDDGRGRVVEQRDQERIDQRPEHIRREQN